MDNMQTVSLEAEQALCRSVLYKALSLGFLPPTSETTARLGSEGAAEVLAKAATTVDPDSEFILHDLARALCRAQDADNVDALSEAFVILFGHTSRGVVPPYETEYGQDAPFLQPQELSDIGGFYRAFGLVLSKTVHERVDHISCECEFLSFLSLKVAYALEEERRDLLEETRRAHKLFLGEHLAQFAATFGRKLAREDPLGLYGRLGNLCIALVQADCKRLGISSAPDHLPIREIVEDRTPMACDTCSEFAVEAEDDY